MIRPNPSEGSRPRILPALLGLLALAAAVLAALPADARKLPVRKPAEAWQQMRADGTGLRAERISHAPSFEELRRRLPTSAQHGHLQLGPVLPSVLQRRNVERHPAALRGGGAPDTFFVKVAVIRVEFDTDREGARTTGDGRFETGEAAPGRFIDPPPHDDAYFAKHLEAVDRYWSSMTYGRVRIQGEVFPRGQRFGAYRLSDMADYGPTSEDEAFSIDGLIRYSRESLIAADGDPDLAWGDWDVLFVVHAGADWQNDVFQDTPLDLPTFSITFSDSELVVSDEGDTLSSMITYPESACQDTYQVGLNGGIAHEMGHQLGLLDIYNVETFAPTVGFYDVMDSGNLTSVFVPQPANADSLVEVIGVLPSAIGAWNRWLVTFSLGLEPELVKGDRSRARLRAIQARPPNPPGTTQWMRLPVSETEYYLLENRVDDLDGKTGDGVYNTALDQDDSTGVILGPIKGDSDEISHNYDLLVDPGVLIWHIDERQALANLGVGRGLNVVFEKRSVTIEEADGLVDIGSPFSPFPLGTDREAFWAGNNSDFTPTSRPNSNTNVGTPSGIAVMNIGARGEVVPMDISFASKPPGWPMAIGAYGTSGGTSVMVADTDGDGVTEVCAAGDDAVHLFAYDDGDGDGDVDSPGAWAPDGLPFRGTLPLNPALADFDGDGRFEIVAATDSGFVHAWTAAGAPYGGAAPDGVILSFGTDAAPGGPVLPADLDGDGTDELYVGTGEGNLLGFDLPAAGAPVARFPSRSLVTPPDSVHARIALAAGDQNQDGRLSGFAAFVTGGTVGVQRFGADGVRVWRQQLALPADLGADGTTRLWMVLADLDRSPRNGRELVLALEPGWITVLDRDGNVLPGWPVRTPSPLGGPPAFGDLDADGLLEMAVGEGAALHAFNYNATEMPGWPVRPRLVDFPGTPRPTSAAAIADVDGDGRLDVVAGFTDFMLRAFDPDGKDVDGFPIPLGAPARSAPAILDADGDGRLDLFVQCGDGDVYAHILAGQASSWNPAWPMFMGGPRLQGFHDAALPGPRASTGALLAGEMQIYPNPVRASDAAVRIRYTLGSGLESSTQVDVSLFNLAGEKVRTVKGSTFANTENVITLPADGLASGVYFCTLRARTGSREETARDRFAVIR